MAHQLYTDREERDAHYWRLRDSGGKAKRFTKVVMEEDPGVYYGVAWKAEDDFGLVWEEENT